MLALLRDDAERCYAHYEEMLNEDRQACPRSGTTGLARELARINLTLATYTEWYWKIDLHNLLHFLSLRADPHAQYEIRVYAEAMLETVRRWVPLTHAAFVKNRLGAVTSVGAGAGGGAPAAGGRRGRPAGQRPVAARVARTDGDARPERLTRPLRP